MRHDSLKSVTLPNRITGIAERAFFFCSSLVRVTIPNSVTAIGSYAFSRCKVLEDIMIPGSVISIGDYAFSACESLKSITIPSSVTSIDDCAFRECLSLERIEFLGKKTAFGTDVAGSASDDSVKPTVYCYANSDADTWAKANGYPRVYLDKTKAADTRRVSLPNAYWLGCGYQATITPSVVPSYDQPAVTWKSSAPEIVSVKNGKLTGKAIGTAVITATVGEASASMNVTVYRRAENFNTPAEIWIEENATMNIAGGITPSAAKKYLTWSIDDSSVAAVDQKGVVSGKTPGDTCITVTDVSGIMRRTITHVCYPVQTVTLDHAAAETYVSGTVQLKATVTSQSGTFENQMVQFSSSDQTVATVSGKGLVTGKKSGTAVITAAAASGAKAEMTVNVVSTVILPDSLNTISSDAFCGLACKAIIIPEGCTGIGSRAFANCKNLLYARIPASVTSIAENAFMGCTRLCIIAPAGSKAAEFAQAHNITLQKQ